MRQPRPRIELDIPIHLDRTARCSLEEQLVEQLRQAILARQLMPGTRLPSTRTLAAALGISRTTTFTAYDRLIAEGYLIGKPGAGTFVSHDLPPARRPYPQAIVQRPRWLHRAAPDIVDEGSALPGMISFRPGVTCMPPISLAQWNATWKRATRASLPTDYCDPEGELILRTALAAYLGRARGVVCEAEDIVITAGSAQALDLIARATLSDGDKIGIEEPGYPMARQIFREHGARLLPLSVDADGLQVSRLPSGPEAPLLVYVTPSHQYPLGSRLSVGRRLALLEWAKEHGSLIIEDDYDSEFRFDAPPLPALAALDTTRQVAYLGTFSKVLTPSLRCGYLVAPPALRRRVTQLTILTGYHIAWPLQQALALFLSEGHLEQHIRRMRQHYAQCRATLHTALAPIAHTAALRGLEAGLHACLELPPDMDVQRIVREARRRDVATPDLARYYAGPPDRQGLVLGYGGLTVDEITTGARRLVEAIEQVTPLSP